MRKRFGFLLFEVLKIKSEINVKIIDLWDKGFTPNSGDCLWKLWRIRRIRFINTNYFRLQNSFISSVKMDLLRLCAIDQFSQAKSIFFCLK